MANSDIGRCKCPFCSGDAALRETSKGRAYIVCEGCAVQSFARGPVSDRIMRGMGKNVGEGVGGNGVGVGGGGESDTAKKTERLDAGAARKAKQAAAVPPSEKPAKAPAATVRTHTADGQTVEQQIAPPAPEETTIFDVLGGIFK